jgi:hypothetical protein
MHFPKAMINKIWLAWDGRTTPFNLWMPSETVMAFRSFH